MNEKAANFFELLLQNYPPLRKIETEIYTAGEILIACYQNGGKLLVCGNGGSASDADHVVGELMKGFLKKRPLSGDLREKLTALQNREEEDGRPGKGGAAEYAAALLNKLQHPLRAINLSAHQALFTAFCNDVDPQLVYAQQVAGYGDKGDVLICFSSSGNSPNVIYAAVTGTALGLTTVGITGEGGGKLVPLCEAAIRVPSRQTPQIQEYHLPIYHALCAAVEAEFFPE
jgi:D-sedoheptulose 7-phosphate isomerase